MCITLKEEREWRNDKIWPKTNWKIKLHLAFFTKLELEQKREEHTYFMEEWFMGVV